MIQARPTFSTMSKQRIQTTPDFKIKRGSPASSLFTPKATNWRSKGSPSPVEKLAVAGNEQFMLISEIEQLRKKATSTDPAATLKKILSALKHMITDQSRFSDLMNWMIQTIEANLFVGPKEVHSLSSEIKEIRMSGILDQQVTFRATTLYLIGSLNEIREELTKNEEQESQSIGDKRESPQLNPEIKSKFFRKQPSLVIREEALERTLPEEMSRKIGSSYAELLSPSNLKGGSKESNGPKPAASPRLLQDMNNYRRTSHRIPAVKEILQSRKQSVASLIMQNINQEASSQHTLPGVRDDIEAQLNEKIDSLYGLNSKLTKEIERMIKQNTDLKLQMIDIQQEYNQTNSRLVTRANSLEIELESLKVDHLTATNQLRELRSRTERTKEVFELLKSQLIGILKTNETVVSRFESYLSIEGREQNPYPHIKLISEPDLLQMLADNGLNASAYGVAEEKSFRENLESFIKSMNKRKSIALKTLNTAKYEGGDHEGRSMTKTEQLLSPSRTLRKKSIRYENQQSQPTKVRQVSIKEDLSLSGNRQTQVNSFKRIKKETTLNGGLNLTTLSSDRSIRTNRAPPINENLQENQDNENDCPQASRYILEEPDLTINEDVVQDADCNFLLIHLKEAVGHMIEKATELIDTA